MTLAYIVVPHEHNAHWVDARYCEPPTDDDLYFAGDHDYHAVYRVCDKADLKDLMKTHTSGGRSTRHQAIQVARCAREISKFGLV